MEYYKYHFTFLETNDIIIASFKKFEKLEDVLYKSLNATDEDMDTYEHFIEEGLPWTSCSGVYEDESLALNSYGYSYDSRYDKPLYKIKINY